MQLVTATWNSLFAALTGTPGRCSPPRVKPPYLDKPVHLSKGVISRLAFLTHRPIFLNSSVRLQTSVKPSVLQSFHLSYQQAAPKVLSCPNLNGYYFNPLKWQFYHSD